eukprot:CAMPEP_0174724936 /NCGR_PEP_ID=MMETSP1094-20130205/44451_1 /TAXON_ID=156173 /ORGANISM="Chrysochromulina brevifilum, Strain UTEX LB 985" /LENGTH=79 /DNA_ID=CAMNT_0015926231 /DNA_START=1 /DNA_END=240 /DNA_ORIENTATION=-
MRAAEAARGTGGAWTRLSADVGGVPSPAAASSISADDFETRLARIAARCSDALQVGHGGSDAGAGLSQRAAQVLKVGAT